MRYLLAALALGAALILGVGLAGARARQDATPPGGKVAGSAASARVDAKARAALDAMASAYRRLASYQATVEVQGGSDKEPRRLRATLALQRPGRAAVVATEQGKVTQSVADGGTLHLLPAEGAAEQQP